MSVQGEINRIKDAVSDAYSAVSDKGGEMPSIQNVDNLAQAVNSIPSGAVDSVNGKTGEVVLTAEDVHALPDDTVIPSLNGYATEAYVNSHHDNTKMDKTNPTGTGSFSLNRKAGTYVGNYSFAEGYNTTASSYYSHAEGSSTIATAQASHAEGSSTKASGMASHAEGSDTLASGQTSHAEGLGTIASGYISHAEGFYTKASGSYSHVQGKYNVEDTNGIYADIIGWGTADDNRKNISALTTGGDLHLAGDVYVGSNADGTGGTKLGTGGESDVFVVEYGVTPYQEIYEAYNTGKVIICYNYPFICTLFEVSPSYVTFVAVASDSTIHFFYQYDDDRFGYDTITLLSTDDVTQSISTDSTSTNKYPSAKAVYDYHDDTKMDSTNPVGTGSFSLNRKDNTTVGNYSFAEGRSTTASGNNSHAEGFFTIASGTYSHAGGSQTTASGVSSHAEGMNTIASGYITHAEGVGTIASGNYSHVQGQYNVEDTDGVYADIVGWGEDNNNRKNISSLTTDGDLHLAGDVYVGANDDGTGGTKLGADIFIAQYGVTTYQDVLNAYNAGKVCFCIKNSDSRFATLCQADSNSFRFAALSGSSVIYNFILFNDNSWLSTSSSYEYSSQKTQTISSSSTTSQYPSAKAVYDFVNGQKPVFVAEYGVTTYQEIKTALQAGKIVSCAKGNYIYYCNATSDMTQYNFYVSIFQNIMRVGVTSNNVWDSGTLTMQLQNITQTVDSSSSTSQYPSAKAVYDYIQSLDAREVSY